MTIDETKQVMAIIELAYPEFYKNFDDEKKVAAIKLWHYKLHDFSYELCNEAVMRMIDVFVFPHPKISDLMQHVISIKEAAEARERERLAFERSHALLGRILNESRAELPA